MKIQRTMILKISKEELQEVIKEHLRQEGFIVNDKDIIFDISVRESGTQRDPYTTTELTGCTITCVGLTTETN